MILLDLVDIILYFGYGMVIVAAVLAVGFPLWIASKNDKVIGFASYDQLRAGVGYRYSMEHTIIVSAEAKGLGVGKKLMDILFLKMTNFLVST